MATLTFEKIKLDAAGLASLFFITAACFLLSFGGLSLIKDGEKVSHYAETTCTVHNATWKNITHLQFFDAVERYVALWEVDHECLQATAMGTKQYIHSSSALAEASKYKVNTLREKDFSIDEILDSFIVSMLV